MEQEHTQRPSNAIDTIIEFIAPRTALKRQKARMALEYIRTYEGGSSNDRLKNWRTGGTSPDAVIIPAVRKLRARIRYLVRNEGLAKKAQRTLATYMIGTGIRGQAEDSDINSKMFNAAYEPWSESRFADFEGHYTVYGLQYLMALMLVESGACLLKKHVAPAEDNPENFVPLQLQLLEPDFIDLEKTEQTTLGGGYIENGVEYNSRGKIVAYWLFKNHPGDLFPFKFRSLNFDSMRVEVTDIEHIYLKTRSGQSHGIPWLECVAIVLKDYGDFEDAHLLRQKIAACFAAFVEDIEPPETNAGGKTKEDMFDKLEPANIEFLPPGRKITFASPPSVEGYGEYTRGQKHRVAAGAMITYETLTNDLSNVNFSSARIGKQDMYMHVDVWQSIVIIPLFCETVKRWFCELAVIAGRMRSVKVKVTWTPPKRPFIEPTKEVKAKSEEVKNGFITLSEVLRSQGKNPKKFLETYAKEQEFLTSLGLKLTSDNRTGTLNNERANNANNTNTDKTEKIGKDGKSSGNGKENNNKKDDTNTT